MESTQKSTAKYWILFLIWLAIMVVMLVMPQARPFFWLALPGVVTYFAYGMGLVE